jgi:hypothetical protein
MSMITIMTKTSQGGLNGKCLFYRRTESNELVT